MCMTVSSSWEMYVYICFYLFVVLTAAQGAEHLKTPIHITPSRASKSAIRAVEKLGGTVFCKYYNNLALRDCVKGRTDRTQAAPVRGTDISAEARHDFTIVINHLLQSGILSGKTEDTYPQKLSRRCLSWRTAGGSSPSNCALTRSKASTGSSVIFVVDPTLGITSVSCAFIQPGPVSIRSGDILLLRERKRSALPFNLSGEILRLRDR